MKNKMEPELVETLLDVFAKVTHTIADDNKEINSIIRSYLEKYEEIEILGCAYSSEEEIQLIENMKPEIVITDLMRKNTLSGLEIIKKYKEKDKNLKFLVISGNSQFVDFNIMDGFIAKPIINYELVIQELRKIKYSI